MTSETGTTRSTTTRSRANGGDPSGTGVGVQAAVREVRNALEGMGRSMPDVARASRGAIDDLVRAVETGSDQQVTAGVSLSLGLAIGMLLGGAPRLLIALVLVPLAITGLAAADRRSGRTRAASSAS